MHKKWLVKPGSPWEHRDIQVQALAELHRVGRVFCAIGVGGGKTLLGMLFNKVLGIPPEEVFALTTAGLRDEALREYDKYAEHMDLDFIEYVGYTYFSRNEHILWDRKPKLIIADEAHYLANQSSVRTKTFVEYMKAHPDTIFVPMTGTPTSTSVKDYLHLLALALGRENNPLPDPWKKWHKVEMLSRVVDPFPEIPPDGTDYGIVRWMLNQGDHETPSEALNRVLQNTPGIVISEDSMYDGPLEFAKWKPTLSAAIQNADDKGSNISQNIQRAMQVPIGFYYEPVYLDCHTPAWRQVNRLLSEEVAEVLKKERRKKRSPLLTEARVLEAMRSGEIRSEVFEIWQRDFEHIPEPEKETIWIDDTVLVQAVERAKEAITSGESGGMGAIIWYDYEAVRERYQELYADDSEVFVPNPGKKPPRGVDKPVVAVLSKSSHATGINLQHDYSWNLDLTPNSEAKQFEQWAGRTHRPGQQERVIIYRNNSVPAYRDAFYRAKKKAEYIEKTLKQRQKLLLGKER